MTRLDNKSQASLHLEFNSRDFPDSPVIKTSPFNAEDMGSIPDRGTKIPHALRPKNQNIRQKQYCNKFNEDFKNSSHQKKNLRKKKKQSNLYECVFTF